MLTLVNGHALKSLPNTIQSQQELEVGLKLQGHPNIVKILDHQIFEKKILIEMELVSSNLLEMSRLHPYGVPIPLLRSISVQLFSALRHIHSSGYIHQDIKLENILIDPSGRIYLIDFEYTIPFDSESVTFRATAGSIHYLSPEAIHNRPCVGPEIDIWSAGVTLYILATGSFPFHGRTIDEVWTSVCNGIELEGKDPASLDNLFSQMFQPDPAKRITIDALEQHPWLKAHTTLVSPPDAPVGSRVRRCSASFNHVSSSTKKSSSLKHSSSVKHSSSSPSSKRHTSGSKKNKSRHSRRRHLAMVAPEPAISPEIEPQANSLAKTLDDTLSKPRKKSSSRKKTRSFKPLFGSSHYKKTFTSSV